MPERFLQLDDIRNMTSAANIAAVFARLGYNTSNGAQPLAIADLDLPSRSAEAIWESYLIADHSKGKTESLQVMLFQLAPEEWSTPSTASNRMRSIAQSLYKRPSEYLLLGTQDYKQLMLVNPRKSLDPQMNLRVGVRKLLIDRTKPTAYDRDRLEAISAHHLSPRELYQKHCEAFDVEKLTKDFYKGYRDIFEFVQQVVRQYNPCPYFDDPSRLHQFSQRLLGRVMFLYFLQKKGFLAGDRDFLKTQYNTKSDLEDGDFYEQVLEPLFFDILNRQRPEHESKWGKIPYLNGGLFDRDYGEGIVDALNFPTPEQVVLPNSLFDPSGERGVLKFFNSYNFTIAENIQGDEDVAVDPEMLGKVFENLLAADERGQSGTFYTPRGIVHFMCVESLSRYLADESSVDLAVVKQLAEYDLELADTNLNQLLTKDQAKKLKKALESVKVCDPAVGSGAFPLGMMQVILTVRQAIARREGMTVQRGSLTMSEWKRDIIAKNLYGVDIKPEAIEIAKLRMWLSMIVDIPSIDDVEPLPNLDYKLMTGNSLISTIHGEQMIPDPTKNQQGMLAVTPVQMEIQKLVDLQQQYFHAQSDERRALREQILETEAAVFRVAIGDRQTYWQGEQRKLAQDIKRMGKASKAQTQKQQMISAKLVELEQVAVDIERGLRSIDFFQWHLHFNEVFHGKGGFDVVIGNPPYVRQEQIKELKPVLKEEYECYTGTADLFVYFFERGFRLLKSNGNLTYICSNKYMRSGYGEKLRKFLSSEGSIQHLIDFGEAPIFEAIAYPSILQVAKTKPKEQQVCSLTWDVEKSVNDFASVVRSSSFLITQKELTPDGWRLECPGILRLMDKLKASGISLGEYTKGRFYYGIKTGLNEAFVVNRMVCEQLVAEHPPSARVLKPLLRGRDVKRWKVDFAEQFLIRIESSDNKTHAWSGATNVEAENIFSREYPAIHAWFEQFRERLLKRDDQGRYFWELRSCKYWNEFEQPKVIIPCIAQTAQYTTDAASYYSNDKTSICVSNDPNYLLGLLNSEVLWWVIQQTASTKQGGFYEFKPMYVSKLPIAEASNTDRKAISALVQKCLDAKGQNVAYWEAEINDRVAHLYGLTTDEMKLIRGE